MATFLTTQTNRHARAAVRSPEGNRISRALDNTNDIAFRVDGAWQGGGPLRGDLSWACGNCGQLLLSDFAQLPFVNSPTLIRCGQCGVDSEAHPADRSPAVSPDEA